MFMWGLCLACFGFACAAFAAELSRLNSRLVTAMPQPLRRFYEAVSGTSYDDRMWTAYNRFGGSAVFLAGLALMALYR